jgi:hypothetical protein
MNDLTFTGYCIETEKITQKRELSFTLKMESITEEEWIMME